MKFAIVMIALFAMGASASKHSPCDQVLHPSSAYQQNMPDAWSDLPVSASRIAEIVAIADSYSREILLDGVVFKDRNDLPYPAASGRLGTGQFVIYINRILVKQFSESAIDLVVFHELGHIWLGHHALVKQHPELAEEIELEADVFGARLYGRFEKVNSGLLSFLASFENDRQMATARPPGALRLRIYKRLLGI